MALPFIKVLYLSLSLYKLVLVGGGGAVYSLGAITYGLKLPKLSPNIFGYHEMFHLLVVVAAIMHFIVIYNLV
jgi:hemolysin III